MPELEPVRIIHFSDLLCVWALVSQIRTDEIQANFAAEVEFDYRFVQVFGDVNRKLAANWSDRGGAAGYADHVAAVAAGFDHIEVSPTVWRDVVPTSSMPAHLVLCAVRVLDDVQGAERRLPRLARRIRDAFFVRGLDVSRQSALLELTEEEGLERTDLEAVLESGAAHAELSTDWMLAREKQVSSSPTLLFNDDRQRLTGNVGYRVLEANVRELLRKPADQRSWC